MPPKPRQLRAPRPKQPGNAFQALVDIPEDGSDSTFDGRDGIVDGTDNNTVVIANPRHSGPPASQQLQHNESVEDNIVVLSQQINDLHYKNETCLYNIEERVSGLSNSQQQLFEDTFQTVIDKLDNLTRKVDKMALEEVALRKAYGQSIAETAALKATVDTLTKQLDEHIVFPALPLPDPTASSTTMEEMTMQLSVVQNDIQDVLEAVRSPPGKRKRRGSDQNTGPTTPTNQRPATNKKRDVSPEHSLMHSQHATSAAQDALDALMRKYPPRPLVITSTEATTDPLLDSNAVQDTTLPDAPTTTAPAEKDGWKTLEGKARQKKRRNDRANNKWAATTANNTPTTKNGGRGKNTHQPRTNTPSTKKTWAEVVKSGGINVQIVLGNGNLGLTAPTTRRGERRRGAARRLGKKAAVGERGEEGRGAGGPKVTGEDGNGTKRSRGERGAESGGGGSPAAL
jgi:regulator of replication initiation timing